MFSKFSITLASESPRRTDILTQLQIMHSIYAPNIDEACCIEKPAEKVLYLAKLKAQSVLEQVNTDIVIAADTIVALPTEVDNRHVLTSPQASSAERIANTAQISPTTPSQTKYRIFEKPSSLPQAEFMLRQLSGKSHEVYTGLCIINKQLSIEEPLYMQLDFATTTVQFIAIGKTLMQEYLLHKEWQGVAGGYRIQGLGAIFVDSIIGNFSTVMGLPINLLYAMMSAYT